MKKLIIILTALLSITVSANAMSYAQAREQALFLTDKMAYELNLTDEQYEAAYEINLDYLMSVNTYDDIYSSYWSARNLDMSYILADWQYENYISAQYFYRPLYVNDGYWHFRIYTRYPSRDYYYFGRPTFYAEYRGSHSWRMNGGDSWYRGRSFGNGYRDGNYFGMRDGFRRGDFGNGIRGINSNRAVEMNNNGLRSFGNGSRSGSFGNGNYNYSNRNNSFGNYSNRNESYGNNNNRSFGGSPQDQSNITRNGSFGNRQSSTRTTVTRPSNSGNGSFGNGSRSGSFENNFNSNSNNTVPNRTFSNGRSGVSSPSYSAPSHSGSFGNGSRSGNSGSNSFQRSNSNSSPSTHSHSGGFGGR